MNRVHHICVSLSSVFVFICAISISAQWNKPYAEMSEKEARKLLNDSPWGHTRVYSYTSGAYSPGKYRSGQRTSGTDSSAESLHYLNIRVRFLSAKPIRQAFSRMMMLGQNGQAPYQLAAQLKAFTTQDFSNDIVVSVDCDATEAKNELWEFKMLLSTRSMADLKSNTYLSAKGQRAYIESFLMPKNDGLGAKFIFPRTVDGKPAIPADSDEIQFYADISSKYKLNIHFKTKDMLVDGKLEY